MKEVMDEWLMGFNSETDFSVNLFSTEKINLKNAIINSGRVNQEFYERKIPFKLKAGMIGKFTVKVSIFTNLFHYDTLCI